MNLNLRGKFCVMKFSRENVPISYEYLSKTKVYIWPRYEQGFQTKYLLIVILRPTIASLSIEKQVATSSEKHFLSQPMLLAEGRISFWTIRPTKKLGTSLSVYKKKFPKPNHPLP